MTGVSDTSGSSTCAGCGVEVKTGTFRHVEFTVYCGACGYVAALREIGADDATIRSAERAAARTRERRDA